jgi:hypothetical protein
MNGTDQLREMTETIVFMTTGRTRMHRIYFWRFLDDTLEIAVFLLRAALSEMPANR